MKKEKFDFKEEVAVIEKLLATVEDPSTSVEVAEKLSAEARERIAACREFLRKERES